LLEFINFSLLDINLTVTVLLNWVFDTLIKYWTNCFSVSFIGDSIPIWHEFFCFLLFTLDLLKFLAYELPWVIIFEIYYVLHKIVIIEPIVNFFILVLQSITFVIPNYFFVSNALSAQLSYLGFVPMVYINFYFSLLGIFIIYFYLCMVTEVIRTIKYFRLSGILFETQNLVNFVGNPAARRLYYNMHFDRLDIKQTSTALSKQRKPTKIVKAFYRKWFGVGHIHFISFKWRAFTRIRSTRKIRMRYLASKRYRQFLKNDIFFYNAMDYIKHIRNLFLRITYSIARLHNINQFYHSVQLGYSRVATSIKIVSGSGLVYGQYVKIAKSIPKYSFPALAYFRIFFGATDMRYFSIRKRFLGFKYFLPYGWPSYLFLSNLAWWFHFIFINSLQILLRFFFETIGSLLKNFYIFIISKLSYKNERK